MLEVIQALPRSQPPGWAGYSRRIDAELLRGVAWPVEQHPLAYICGPTPFVETAAAAVICPIKNDDCQIICHEAKRLQRIASAT